MTLFAINLVTDNNQIVQVQEKFGYSVFTLVRWQTFSDNTTYKSTSCGCRCQCERQKLLGITLSYLSFSKARIKNLVIKSDFLKLNNL